MKWHNSRRFSTYDRDQDNVGSNCAKAFKGGWWYSGCYDANLNGRYLTGGVSDRTGIQWKKWLDLYSLKSAEMKIRKK